jgi:hypothetical protein
MAWLTAVGVVTGVAVGGEVSSGVGDVMAVGVEVEVGDGVEVKVGDGAADKGVGVAGAGGPKGEQPSPMIATTARIQAMPQNLLGTEGRIDDPLSTDRRRFISNKYNVISINPVRAGAWKCKSQISGALYSKLNGTKSQGRWSGDYP